MQDPTLELSMPKLNPKLANPLNSLRNDKNLEIKILSLKFIHLKIKKLPPIDVKRQNMKTRKNFFKKIKPKFFFNLRILKNKS